MNARPEAKIVAVSTQLGWVVGADFGCAALRASRCAEAEFIGKELQYSGLRVEPYHPPSKTVTQWNSPLESPNGFTAPPVRDAIGPGYGANSYVIQRKQLAAVGLPPAYSEAWLQTRCVDSVFAVNSPIAGIQHEHNAQ